MSWILGSFLVALVVVMVLPAGMALDFEGKHTRRRLILMGVRLSMRFPRRASRRTRVGDSRDRKFVTSTVVRRRSLLFRFFFSPWHPADLLDLGLALKRLSKTVRVRLRNVEVVVASPDPALTGIAYGAACAASGMFLREAQARFNVDFTTERPTARGRIEISVIPVLALVKIMSVLWTFLMRSPRRMRIAWTLYRDHRRNHG